MWRARENHSARLLYMGVHRDHSRSVSASLRYLDEREAETLRKLITEPELRRMSVRPRSHLDPQRLAEISAVCDANAVWLFSPQGKLIAATGESASVLPTGEMSPQEVVDRSTGASRGHFYVHYPQGVESIRFARIFSPDGSAGFVAAGRYLDRTAIQSLVDHTESDVVLGSQRVEVSPEDQTSTDAIFDTIALPGRDGKTIDTLSFRHSSPYISQIVSNSEQTILMAVALVVALTTLFFLALYVWVSRPISLLTSFMQGQESTVLGNLRKSAGEFGELARLATEHRSQQRELEQNFHRLNQAEQRMRFHFEQTSLAVIEWDRDLHVVEWNRAAERVFGFTREEAIGRSGLDLIVPDSDRDAVAAMWPKLIAGTEAVTLENMNQRKNGDQIYCEWYNTPLWASGEVVGVASLAMDVTPKVKALDEARRAREDALEASRMKSEFLANMSHEIRTPMNGVVGMAGLLLDTQLNEDQRTMAETIAVSADGLLSVINDILDLSKIEAGKMDFSPAPFDIHAMVDQIIRLFQPQATQVGLSLSISMSASLPQWVLGDGARVRQIMANLLSNSLKFTHEGSITLTVDQLAGQRVWISVRDTGIGIPIDRQDAIFDAFTQADGSTTRRYGGTGLGLTICRHLARIMGGTLGLSSRIGEGTEFWVELPMPEVAVKEDEIAPAIEQTQLCLRVLLAEDNAVNERVALRMLSMLGCDADVARNGAEAVRLSAENNYDVILMDVHMPVMDGIEATRLIRSRGISSPIIALTASVMKQDIDLCIEAGMNFFLGKPVRREELTEVLSKLAERRQAA